MKSKLLIRELNNIRFPFGTKVWTIPVTSELSFQRKPVYFSTGFRHPRNAKKNTALQWSAMSIETGPSTLPHSSGVLCVLPRRFHIFKITLQNCPKFSILKIFPRIPSFFPKLCNHFPLTRVTISQFGINYENSFLEVHDEKR